MNFLKNTILLLLLLTTAAINPAALKAQSTATLYQQRAKTIYASIWKNYRVNTQPGLFLESFPSNKNDSLTYMQGGNVSEKPVSYLWPFSGMFSATNVLVKIPALSATFSPFLDTLVTGVMQYRDTVREPAGYQAYPVKFEKADRYYDDNGLVGIDYMELYFNTKNPLYLARAKEVFNFIISGWNNDLGGGVPWLEGHNDQKPACTNGMATLTALKIYQGSKEDYYLKEGKKIYHWMYKTLLDSTGVIANDIKPGGKLNRTFWTYNTGSLIESAVLLYQYTGERQYLQQAQQLARDSYKYFSTIRHDKNLTLHIDLPWFVTVLFRGYEALYHTDGHDKYVVAVERDLNYAWEHTRDQYGYLSHSWTANPAEIKKPKWLLDEACIAELYARLSLLKMKSRRIK